MRPSISAVMSLLLLRLTYPEKSLVRLLAVVVGGWCWGCGGLVGFTFACFM